MSFPRRAPRIRYGLPPARRTERDGTIPVDEMLSCPTTDWLRESYRAKRLVESDPPLLLSPEDT